MRDGNKLCRLLFIFCVGCFAAVLRNIERGRGRAEHELLTLINFLRDLAAFSLNWVFNYGRLWRPGQPRPLINCHVPECLFSFNGSGVIVRKSRLEVEKLENTTSRTFGNSRPVVKLWIHETRDVRREDYGIIWLLFTIYHLTLYQMLFHLQK